MARVDCDSRCSVSVLRLASVAAGLWLALPCLLAGTSWQDEAPLAIGRNQFAAAAVDGKLHVYGGNIEWVDPDGPAETDVLEIFDPATGAWSQGAGGPEQGEELSGACIDGVFYVQFGLLPWVSDDQDRRSGRCLSYTAATNTWAETTARPTLGLWNSIVVHDGRLYCFGAFGPDWEDELEDMNFNVQIFDPGTNAWTQGAAMPTAILNAAAAVVDGKAYFLGGYTLDGDGVPVLRDSPASYDFATDTWQLAGLAPIPRPRGFAPAAAAPVVNGLIVCAGGCRYDEQDEVVIFAEVDIYDPATDSWLRGPALPTPTANGAALAVDQVVYHIGGSSDGTEYASTVWSWDASDIDADGLPDAWERVLVEASADDGIASIVALRPEDDFDGDGASNELEWRTSHDAASDGDAPDPADMLAYGDQALRDRDLRLAHAAYLFAASGAPSPSASFSAATTTLFDLFERPTPDLAALLDAWDVVYEKDVFASQDDLEMLASEPFTDRNGNGEWDEGEQYWDDGWTAPLYWGQREEWDDNGVWDHEPFDDENGNGWRDDGEIYTDENGDGVWSYEGYNDENGNGWRDYETFEDLNANGEWDEHGIFPDDAPTPNQTLDTLRTEADTRIDLVLGLLGSVLTEAPADWTRTVTADMLPDQWSDLDRQRLGTIDRTDVQAASAILHATKGLLAFLGGYDLDVPYDDLNWTDGGLFRTLWTSHSNLLVPRAERAAAFDEAREHFRTALGFAGDALDGLVDGQTQGGWLERQQYPADNIDEYRAAAEDVLASLDGPHQLAADDFADLHADLVLDLSPLFDSPIDRRDILPYDFDVSAIDWLAADPTLKGLFPDETPTSWYGRVAFLHNRDNEEWEHDWPALADELDGNAADAAIDLTKAAVRFLGAYDLTADYDAVSSDVNVDLVLGALWDDGGDFLQVRDATRLAEAKPLFKSGLDKALVAIDQYLAGPDAEATPGYLFAEEGDCNQDRLLRRRANLDDARLSLDGPHAWDDADYEKLDAPLVVDLGPLFDNPIERTDLLPYDFFGEDIDWLALDPDLHGILPQETRPSLYRRYVFWSDDEDLVPLMNAVDDEFAEAVTDAAEAAIQLLAGYDLRPTSGNIPLDEENFTKALWEDNANVLTLRDSPTRAGSTFAAARTSFASALDKAVAATDRMLADEGRGGIADRHEWCHLDGDDSSQHSPYHADWLETRRYLTAWQQAMGDTGADLPINRDDPILVHLRQLFDNPLSRDTLPADWRSDDDRFDWTTIPDSTFNGLFPGFSSKAHLYANYTHYFETPGVLLATPPGDTPQLVWLFDEESLGWWWSGYLEEFQRAPLEFASQLARFDVYRRTRDASGVSDPVKVASLLPADFADDEIWHLPVSEPPEDAAVSYQVDVVFGSDERAEASTLTQWCTHSFDSNGDGVPNWWDDKYGVSGSWNDDDDDGADNGDEYEAFTNPILPDTDGDGIPDGIELLYGLNPLADDTEGDLDGDGYSNGFELSVGSNPALYESNPLDSTLALSWVASPADGSNPMDARLPGPATPPRPYAPGALSADGSRFFFLSSADWFGPGGTGIYAHDVASGTEILVSAADGTDDVPSDGFNEFLAANSNGGRYVLFLSSSTNLTDDASGDTSFYLRDTGTNTTLRLPIPSGGAAQPRCAITPDGAFLAVEAYDEATGKPCVYRYDRRAGVASRCWASPARDDFSQCYLGPPDDITTNADARFDTTLSDDGRYVFLSTDASFGGAQSNGCLNVYRFDAETGAMACASVDPDDNSMVIGTAEFVAASRDAHLVLWRAQWASFSQETESSNQLLLRDVENGRTVRIWTGSEIDFQYALLSADGRYVAFTTASAPRDDAGSQLRLFDWVNEQTQLLHHEPYHEGDVEPLFPASSLGFGATADRLASCISGDGRYIFFSSRSSDLAIDGNPEDERNVFRYDTQLQLIEQVNRDSYGEAGQRSRFFQSGWGDQVDDTVLGITQDGHWMVLSSQKNLANEREWFRDREGASWSCMFGRSLFLVDLTGGGVTTLPGGRRDDWTADDERTPLLATHAPVALTTVALFAPDGTAARPISDEMLADANLPTEWQNSIEWRLGCLGWLDVDADGLPDAWEQTLIDADAEDGVETTADVRPEDDFDGDGASNELEWRTGHDATSAADAPDPADMLAYGDQALRDRNFRLAHAAYLFAAARQPSPSATFSSASTTLFDLFERPTPELAALLDAWEVLYERDVFAPQEDPAALVSEPFTDRNGNGEWDEGEPFSDDGLSRPTWEWRGDWADNEVWDCEPFSDDNNNGWRDEGELYTDENGDGSWNYEDYWDENWNDMRDCETFEDLNANGEWDQHGIFPAGLPTPNETFDTLRTEADTRIDLVLGLLGSVLAEAPADWTRTVTADMLPGQWTDRGRERLGTIDRTDVQVGTAALHATKGLLAFVGGYDLNVPYGDLNWTKKGMLRAFWTCHSSVLAPRAERAAAFDEAREHFRTALGFVGDALDGLVGGQTQGGWLERQQYPADNIAEYRAATEDVLACLDGPHQVTADDFADLHADLVLDLSPLFDSPIDRRDILPYDFDVSAIDWLAADPTLKGLFPEETPTTWYGRAAFLHNRDNEEWEHDWPELADGLDGNAADAAIDLAKAAVGFLGAYDLTADYDAVSSDVNVDLVLGALWDDGGDFLQVRDATRLAEARPLFKSGLDKALLAIDQYLAGPDAEATPGYLFAEEGDCNQDRLLRRRANLDDARRSLDAPHAWDSADYEELDSPLVVDLRPLFDNPIERTDLLPYDFFDEDIDWLALDPNLHGILPQETRPSLYRRYVFWSDDDDLVPLMNAVDDEFAEAVTDAAEAAIQLLAGYDLRPTSGDIAIDDLDFTKTLWEDNANILTLRDAPARAGSTFEQAKTSFGSALDKAVAATDRMLAEEGRGGIADRHEWCHLDRSNDSGTIRHSPYYADWLETRRHLTAWQQSMGGGGADLPLNADDPILVHLRQLFDNPLSRASLPTGWEDTGDDQFWRRFDWTTIAADSTLNGLFPGFSSKAHVYANYTHYFESCRAWISSTELGWYFREESPEFFEQLARFDIYRRTRNASGVTEPVQVASFLPSAVGERQTWHWLVPDPPADGEHSYQVEFVFASDDGGEAGTRTPQWLVRATNSNGNDLPDWWENAYGVSGSWGYDDEDGDGVSNRDEYEASTDPTLRDTDGDGMLDSLECFYGMDPLLDDAASDLDADGYANDLELSTGSNPALYESNPADRALPASWVASPIDGANAADATLPGPGVLPRPYAPGALSSDGSRFFFLSAADWFGGGGTGIYAHDVASGSTILVDAADGTADTQSDGGSDVFLAANSDGGRYVLFLSSATNLTADAPGSASFYLRDTEANTTRLLPIPGAALVSDPQCAITPDGTVLAVETIDEDTGDPCVYRYDRVADQAVRCWTDTVRGDFTSCTLGPPSSTLPQYPDWRLDTALSADGRYVFVSTDAPLGDDDNDCIDIYRFDAASGTMARVTVDPAGSALTQGIAEFIAASGDGRIALWCAGQATFGQETDPLTRLMIRDMARGRTVQIPDSEGLLSQFALLSRDGRYVAFTTTSEAERGTNSQLKLFDRVSRETRLLREETNEDCLFPVVSGEEEANGDILASCFSEDGRYIFFGSRDSALALDGNPYGRRNFFRYDVQYETIEQVNRNSYGEAGDNRWLRSFGDESFWPGPDDRLLGITRDGRWVVLASPMNLANVHQWVAEVITSLIASLYAGDDAGMEEQSFFGLPYLADLTRGEVVALPGTIAHTHTIALATHTPKTVCRLPLVSDNAGILLPLCPETLLPSMQYPFDGAESRLGAVGWLDTDGDGLSDRFEKDFGLGPLTARGRWQDDEDGLSPRDEEFYDTDPTNPDTDGDGMRDGDEVACGTDPKRRDADEDPDGDGWTNAEEVAAGWNAAWPDRSWVRHIGTGWNLNAIPPGLAEEERLSDVFRDAERSPITIYRYDATRLRYRNAALETLSEEIGYWLAAGTDYDLDFTPDTTRAGARDEDAPTTVDLVPGWNLVSIPGYQEYPDVWTVFLRYPAITAVWGWDGATGQYYAIQEGDLDCLDAYWVYALEAVTVRFEGAE